MQYKPDTEEIKFQPNYIKVVGFFFFPDSLENDQNNSEKLEYLNMCQNLPQKLTRKFISEWCQSS